MHHGTARILARYHGMDSPKGTVFKPELVEVMDEALQLSVDALPEPVSSGTVQELAKAILHNANDGTTDPDDLSRLALLEIQLH